MFTTTPSCPIVHCPTWASLQVDEGWWIGEAHGRFGLFPANYVEVPCPFPSTQTFLSHTIYIVHHDHYDRCGNDVSEEDAEVEVGVERRNEAELANIKTFCPVDLYLLCIISFPKHIFRKVDYMIDIMVYVSCFSTDKKGSIVFSNSPRRSCVLCIILVVVFWAMLRNCPRHAYRLYI